MKASNQDAGARELERMQREKIAQNSHVFAKQWTELDKRTEKESTLLGALHKKDESIVKSFLERTEQSFVDTYLQSDKNHQQPNNC